MELDSELDPDPHYEMYANPKYRPVETMRVGSELTIFQLIVSRIIYMQFWWIYY